MSDLPPRSPPRDLRHIAASIRQITRSWRRASPGLTWTLTLLLGVIALSVTLSFNSQARAAAVCPTCDDGVACTADVCQNGTTCVHTPLDDRCDDNNDCTSNICDVAAGGCRQTLRPGCCFEPANCDDGRVCTIDRCNAAGRCEYETRENCCDSNVLCDDSDACTADRCDLSSGLCTHAAIGGCCRRDKDCVGAEPCQQGTCDTNAHLCRWSVADEGAPCRDFDPCSLDEQCLGGRCVAGTFMSCDSDLPCVQGACATGLGCVYENTASCCSADADCNDGVICTLDACDGLTGQCRNIPLMDCCLGDVDCNDGLRCTTDQCGPDHRCRNTRSDDNCCEQDSDCDDANSCTINRCDVDARTCRPPRVTAEGAACDDGDACTQETFCRGGECLGVPRDCDDLAVCTVETCDPVDGCVSSSIAGCCNDDNDCPSGDQCNRGYCDMVTGTCVSVPKASACDDGDPCTTDDRCADGVCVPGVSVCDDGDPCTTDICAGADGCQNTPIDGCCIDSQGCGDGNVCNGTETCVANLCKPGAPPPCDDWDACTVDSCLPETGCVNARLGITDDPACAWRECGGDCDDGDPCTDDVCERVTAVCQHLPRYAPPDCELRGVPGSKTGCAGGGFGDLNLLLILVIGLVLALKRRRAVQMF